MWIFTPEAAGRVGAILAVLLLVALFTPQLRGSLATVVVRDPNGVERRIPEQPSRLVRWMIRYQVYGVTLGLLAIVCDLSIAAGDEPLTDEWAMSMRAINIIACASAVALIGIMSYQHAHQKDGDRQPDAK